MLASEDESRALAALRSSLASEIVELVVLTTDEAFLQTLREGVGSSRRLWHVMSSDKVSDLLVAGGVGILVLDVHALHEAAARFITDIKHQFPDLVVVVAGNRDAENELARLISDGLVYRFIHKPMSPARASLFAEAAVKRFDEQRRRSAPGRSAPTALAAAQPRGQRLVIGAICAALGLLLGSWWLMHRADGDHAATLSSGPASAPPPAAVEAPGVPENGGPAVRGVLAEAQERLLARAETALQQQHLDEAASAIEAARKAGIDTERVAFLATELAKARERSKALPPAPTATPAETASPKGMAADRSAALAMEMIKRGQLIEPEDDNARFYVQQALRENPKSEAGRASEEALATALLAATREAIGRRDFSRASSLLDAAGPIAAPASVDELRQSLAAARAPSDRGSEMLKSAQQSLAEDRLVEPPSDNAAYYVTTLRRVDPQNPGLAQVTDDLGGRLVTKGRAALGVRDFDAARAWLDQAASIGYASPQVEAARRDLEAALVTRNLTAEVITSNQLELVKSVAPVYPARAEKSGIEGWVDLEFTVSEAGGVQDVAVRAGNPKGVFDQAATAALLQWRYKPFVLGAKPVARRARIRIRFELPR